MLAKIIFSFFALYIFSAYSTNTNVTILPGGVIRGVKPETCPSNEEPTDCVSYCLPTCDKPKTPPCVFVRCPGGCVCKEGYIRETNRGKCVPISSCVNPADVKANYTEPCKENEEPLNCVVYEAHCNDLTPPEFSITWCSAGCACKEGYVRKSETDRECVLIESCNKTQVA